LLGAGDKKGNRTYLLDCGHEQVILLQKMRTGAFRCKTCVVNNLKKEAELRGCELLGAGKDCHYRTYRLPCGHEQVITTRSMRLGNFRCQICLDTKLNEEANAQGCVLLGAGKNANYRIYSLPCGHEQEITLANMRGGRLRCQICLDNNLIEEARAQGCELLGSGKDATYRTYRLPCGHVLEVGTGAMRIGQFRCQVCFDNKLNEEAKAQGCELLGSGKDANYRTYRLNCGHQQEVGTREMRTGSFRCQTCEEFFYTLPSNAYLLHIKVGADEWLKLGYAKDVDFRTTRYGLPSEAEVSVLATMPFDTGKEAQVFEQSLHKNHKRKRLPVKEMLNFHTGSGATECYPVTMVETLLAEFKNAK